eukprot:gnl/Hemi2/17984_TR5936_c0_g1_i1.p1 gnl/Hemi2/17984_TR5936_c0_g1~~gnl/Hemi2/17984_TR5936_c0_g1_i1.p1  ORF type:complete len:304 (+),score=112.02 gnl/Hemi2/17984_TR5936_c0_g1_i1:172-1083(+)
MSSHRASLDEERGEPLLAGRRPSNATQPAPSYPRVFLTAIVCVALVAGVVVGVVYGYNRLSSNASDEDDEMMDHPLTKHDLEEDANDSLSDTDDDKKPTNASKVLKPSCESVAKKKFGHKHKNAKLFKYPSDLPEHHDVYCVPVAQVRFTQDTVSSESSSGHTLDWWINKMQTAGYFAKSNLPDMVRWNDEVFQSIDNRRIYCAKKAGITYVPAHLHGFEEPLPQDQLHRFPITITSHYFSGTKYAPTWGSAAIFRSVTEQTVDFPIFGRLDLPEVIYWNNTSNATTTTPPAAPTTNAIEIQA